MSDLQDYFAGHEPIALRGDRSTRTGRYLGLTRPPEPTILPTDSKARKDAPLARGLLDYFPRALVAVANLSRIGNEKHNPGEPLHWSKEKSNDHADCIVRHLIERGTVDLDDGQLHSTKVAWRALALLEIELESGHE